jgi:2-deoxy-D-gluconate 3-dehydrogenase
VILIWMRPRESPEKSNLQAGKRCRRTPTFGFGVKSNRWFKREPRNSEESKFWLITRKPAEEITEEEWDKVIDINLKGTFLCAQTVGKAMIQRGEGGRIINIASIMGGVALPPRAAYCASKGGIIALTKDLAAEWAKYGVTVNTISPGWTVTEMTQAYFSQEEVRGFLLERIPLNRLGKPEDISNLAVFLASEYSGYITGQAIFVDGGWTIL